MDHLKEIYANAPSVDSVDEMSLFNHSNIATCILDMKLSFEPFFSDHSISATATVGQMDLVLDGPTTMTNVSVDDTTNIKRRRLKSAATDESPDHIDESKLAILDEPHPHSLKFASTLHHFPPLYLLPISNGFDGDIIDRWHQPSLSSSSLYPNDPNQQKNVALHELLTHPSLALPLTVATSRPVGATVPNSSISSAQSDDNDGIDSNDKWILNNLLPPVWPIPPVDDNNTSGANIDQKQDEKRAKWWFPIGRMGSYGHGLFHRETGSVFAHPLVSVLPIYLHHGLRDIAAVGFIDHMFWVE
jgi:hypothetical protein